MHAPDSLPEPPMHAFAEAPAPAQRPAARLGPGGGRPKPEPAARPGPPDQPPVPAAAAAAPPRDWTALPEAAAILADCAARPPATRMVKVVDLSTFHALHYVGARVRRLRAIHRAEADRLFALGEAARDYGAFEAHVRRTVQQAIANALLHAALARSAACDARALDAID